MEPGENHGVERHVDEPKPFYSADIIDHHTAIIERAIRVSLLIEKLSPGEKEHLLETKDHAVPSLRSFESYIEQYANHEDMDLECDALTEVDLLQVKALVVSEGISYIKALASLKNLEHLTLNGARLSELSALAKLRKLTSLDVRVGAGDILNFPSDGNTGPLSDISHLSKLTRLEFLDVSFHNIHDLTPLSGLNRLSRLHLGSNRITDLSPLSGLDRLERLILNNNQIQHLGPLAKLKKLNFLSLETYPDQPSNPGIGKDEIDRLKKALPNCGTIMHAHMTDAERVEVQIRRSLHKPTGEVTQEDYERVEELGWPHGVSDLTLCKRFIRLKELYLSPPVTDLSHLIELKQIKRIHVRSCHTLTEDEKERFFKARPDCILE